MRKRWDLCQIKSLQRHEYPRQIPDFQFLSTKKPEEWTEIELLQLHRTMSDLSPWLHEQDTAMS